MARRDRNVEAYSYLLNRGRIQRGERAVTGTVGRALGVTANDAYITLSALLNLGLAKGERAGARSINWIEAVLPDFATFSKQDSHSRMVYLATVLGARGFALQKATTGDVVRAIRLIFPDVGTVEKDLSALATRVQRWAS